MEYKLNKIDMEIRNTINEQTAEGKIHSKQKVELNSEKMKENMHRDNKRQKRKQETFNISKYAKKNKFVEVKVYKSQSVEVQVEKQEIDDKDCGKGLFIDLRR